MKTIKMSNYSVAKSGYPELAKICEEYNYKKVVIIGGKKALNAASNKIVEALKGSDIEITGIFIYGNECSMTNVNKLLDKEEVQNADVIFTVGSGKALDTGKVLANIANKNIFTFPTICSNCAAVTAIAVVYNDDKSFSHYENVPAPAHMFVETSIIAEAPTKYIWAGIGDGLSKQPEVEYATKGLELNHTAKTGLTLSKSCEESFIKYGEQAVEDCKNKKNTIAIEEIAMNILVSTGYVSNLTNQPEYYYNSSLAHIFYNTSTNIHRKKEYSHGEVVAFGVMVLHAYAKNQKGLETIAAFNKKIGLPTTLADIDIIEDNLIEMAEAAPSTTEWKKAAFPFSKEKFIQAMKDADSYGRSIA